MSQSVDQFIANLKKVAWRIKFNDKWYELRLKNNSLDQLYKDTKGELFGLPNVQVNFCVFNAGTDELAEWAKPILKDFFARMPEYQDPSDLFFGGFITYDGGFVQHLLDRGGFAVFSPDGQKQRPWQEGTIF